MKDWSKEAQAAFCTEVQNKGLLMSMEYKISGQVYFQIAIHLATHCKLGFCVEYTYICV